MNLRKFTLKKLTLNGCVELVHTLIDGFKPSEYLASSRVNSE